MRIAITGGIGEGKSTVLHWLADLGFSVTSADEIAKEIRQSEAVRSALHGLVTGTPAEIRAAIAVDPDLRRQLNAVMHPLILAAIRNSEAQFVEVPLLLETCLQNEFDEVWVVTCGEVEQRRRLVERYGDHGRVDQMLQLQLPTRAKTPFADLIVRTNAPLGVVRQLVEEYAADRFGK